MSILNAGSGPRRFLTPWLSLLLGIAASGALHAQNARVVSASSTTGRLNELDFATLQPELINSDFEDRVRLSSVLFRDDGAGGVQLLVTDDLAGQVLYYPDSASTPQVVLDNSNPGHPGLPSSLSQGAARNLFGLSVNGMQASLWVLRWKTSCSGSACLPGGYEGPVGYLDTSFNVGAGASADRLADTFVVTVTAGGLTAGDLLLVSTKPAQVLRYRAADITAFLDTLGMGGVPAELTPDVFIHPPSAAVPAAQRFPVGALPSGITIEPGGRLLIPSGDGVVYAFLPDGTRQMSGGAFVDLVTGLAPGRYSIASGNQDGEPRAYLSDFDGRRVMRYTIQADGTGLLDATITDLATPVSIDATTSSVVSTPAGSGVTVSTSNLMTSRIANVVSQGSSSVTEFVFVDPREAEIATPVGQPLHRSLFLDEISSLLPTGIEIPPYVRAMRKGNPLTGPPTFILLVVDTTYEVLGPVNHEGNELLVLGYDPDCNDPDPTLRPRMFWVPNLDEPSSPEGPVFINVSNGCGPQALLGAGKSASVRSKGVTIRFSLFLVGARDTRPWNATAQAQLDGLGLVLASSSCIPQPVLGAIQTEYNAAVASFGALKLRNTTARLRNIVNIVRANPVALAGCSLNEGGGLVARALSTIFTLGTSPKDSDVTPSMGPR